MKDQTHRKWGTKAEDYRRRDVISAGLDVVEDTQGWVVVDRVAAHASGLPVDVSGRGHRTERAAWRAAKERLSTNSRSTP